MAKVDLKTKENTKGAIAFLNSLKDEKKKTDALKLLELMQQVSGEEPVMWGESIIGFGKATYTRSNGDVGEWFKIGLSPRKQNLTLYLTYGFEKQKDLINGLGKYKTGKVCLYIKSLEDIDLSKLKKLITFSYKNSYISDNNK